MAHSRLLEGHDAVLHEPEGKSGRRLENLKALVARARRYGIGIYLYLNEPRALPAALFEKRPELAGVAEGTQRALCTSVPAVREFISGTLAHVFASVPDLAGVFIFLLPFCALVWITAWPYVLASWRTFEGSLEIKGLPGVFLLKSFILVYVALLALQSLSLIARSLLAIAGVTTTSAPAEKSAGLT